MSFLVRFLENDAYLWEGRMSVIVLVPWNLLCHGASTWLWYSEVRSCFVETGLDIEHTFPVEETCKSAPDLGKKSWYIWNIRFGCILRKLQGKEKESLLWRQETGNTWLSRSCDFAPIAHSPRQLDQSELFGFCFHKWYFGTQQRGSNCWINTHRRNEPQKSSAQFSWMMILCCLQPWCLDGGSVKAALLHQNCTFQDEMSSEHFMNRKSKPGLWGFTIVAFTEQSPPFWLPTSFQLIFWI